MAYFAKVGARMPGRDPDLDLKVYKRATEYPQRVLWGPFKDRRPLEEDEKSADGRYISKYRRGVRRNTLNERELQRTP